MDRPAGRVEAAPRRLPRGVVVAARPLRRRHPQVTSCWPSTRTAPFAGRSPAPARSACRAGLPTATGSPTSMARHFGSSPATAPATASSPPPSRTSRPPGSQCGPSAPLRLRLAAQGGFSRQRGHEQAARQRPPPAVPFRLLWTTDGTRLVAISRAYASRCSTATVDRSARSDSPAGRAAAAVAPGSHRLAPSTSPAYVARWWRSTSTGCTPCRSQVFSGAGRFSGVAWSPDGRWLLLAWKTADQWVFVRTAGNQRIAAVSAISSQFSPGRKHVSSPSLGGWCCSEP